VRSVAFVFLVLAANLAWNPVGAGAAPQNAPQQDAPPIRQEQKSELPSQYVPQAAEHEAASASDSKLVLHDGTPVRLKFIHAVDSSQVIAGETIDLQVVQEVRLGSRTVIPEHSPAKATVTLAQAKRAMGRGGNLEMKIDTVRLANGETAPLRTVKDVKGGGSKGEIAGGVVAAGLLFLPAAPFAFFIRGKNAVVPEGTEMTVYVNGDVSLDPEKFPVAGVGPQAPPEPKVQQERGEPK